MKCNVAKSERVIRIIIGSTIVGAGLFFNSWLGVIGLVPVLTGATGFCPAYLLKKAGIK